MVDVNRILTQLQAERSSVGKELYRLDEAITAIRKVKCSLGKHYSYYGSDQCQKEWEQFRKFRVIIVLRNEERRNLLTALGGQYNHRMFWVTTEDLYKQGISGRIFQTPRDFVEGVLYSLNS
jgi:hypothetical protein